MTSKKQLFCRHFVFSACAAETELCLTHLFLSKDTQTNGDQSCPLQLCFEEFTSHQLDLRRTAHANLALKSERSARRTPGHLSSGAYYLESSKPTHLLYSLPLLFSYCDPAKRQPAPATWAALLLPCKECEQDWKCPKSNMNLPASPNHTMLPKRRTWTH